MLVVVIIVAIILLVLALLFFDMYREQKRKVKAAVLCKDEYHNLLLNETAEKAVLLEKAAAITDRLKEAISRNKSVEVRTGFIMEKIAPFTEAFGENPKNVKHLGDPIDYVCFEDDYICFVEVKTGKSRLSSKQNKIKKLIEEGKVNFKTVRYDYE
jgi:predicted Holliday junction resolvase-like endonuclease